MSAGAPTSTQSTGAGARQAQDADPRRSAGCRELSAQPRSGLSAPT